MDTVQSGDTGNVEAKAAVYYWSHLFPHLPTFVRDRAGDPPNNLLNYGYAILRGCTARSLVAAGLLPTFGIHHRNRYNAYCLADDIMEPYRPFVDMLVLEIMDVEVPPEILEKRHQESLLKILQLDVYIEGKTSPLMVALQTTSTSLFRCFSGESRKMAYPILKI